MKAFSIFEAPLNGINLVEAGAGTGKTYNIEGMYIRAVIEKNLMPGSILVLTYTVAASTELRSRIRAKLVSCIKAYEENHAGVDAFLSELLPKLDKSSYGRLKQALYSFDEAVISTIHGFCSSLLKEEYLAFGINPDFELVGSESEVLADCIDRFWHNFISEYSDSDAGKSALAYLISEKITPAKLGGYVNAYLEKSYAVIKPDCKPLAESFELFAELASLSSTIRRQYEEDGAILREILENKAGVLNGTTYRKGAPYFSIFEAQIHSALPVILPFYKMESFRASAMLNAVNKGKSVYPPTICYQFDEYSELLAGLPDFKLSFLRTAIEEIHRDYDDAKKSYNQLVYNDLIRLTAEGLEKDSQGVLRAKLAKKYPLALVDEFQDTDPQQYKIFSTVYGREHTALFMIGDPKQAIYSFRGADLFTYLTAKEDADQDRHYYLSDNYRSNKPLLQAVNSLFDNLEHPFLLDGIQFRPAGYPDKREGTAPPVLHLDGAEQHPVQFINLGVGDLKGINKTRLTAEVTANEVFNLLRNNYTLGNSKVKSSDIAILVKRNMEAATMQQELAALGIKSIIHSKESVFNTTEAADLRILLTAVAETGYEASIRLALLTSFFNYDAHRVLELTANEELWPEVIQKFRYVFKLWREKGILHCLNEVNREFGILERLAAYKNGERRITNYNHIAELLSAQETAFHAGPSSLLRYLSDKINEGSREKEDEMLRLESDEDLVQIVTMHSSKGLEYPIVFLPYLWSSVERKNTHSDFFNYNDSGRTILNIGGSASDSVGYRQYRMEVLGESMRLLYVGLTRAVSANFIPFTDDDKRRYSMLDALVSGPSGIEEHLFSDNKTELPSLSESLKALKKYPGILVRNRFGLAEQVPVATPDNEPGFNAVAQLFKRDDLMDYPRITSYSALTEASGQSGPAADSDSFGADYDEWPSAFAVDEEETGSSGMNVFNFPKGAAAGTFLHAILEETDFDTQQYDGDAIGRSLEQAGFDEAWAPMVAEWLKAIHTHPILSGGTSLSLIDARKSKKELEFHFPISRLKAEDIYRIIRPGTVSEIAGSDRAIHGFMKGFIDLLFEHNGKYYVLDYKSNHMGHRFEDYGKTALKKEITSAGYDVQYHIYSVAVHRMLKNILPEYDYDTHFGGVIYLFLRGLNREDTSLGVYFDVPKPEIITRLDEMFKTGGAP